MAASLADELVRFGAPIAAGAGVGAALGGIVAALVQLWVTWPVPIERWLTLGTVFGSMFGLAALALDGVA